ncbi:TetR/AcrR family transcriptional regulator [Aquabacterium sp.]|uniref:TetR/AcrR family transcriptional regulator n=1 Tax=Aquabacterium sp. TaxID=1872578 RepID=UPI0035AECB95
MQTRDLLVQAALKLFARHGLDGVSLRQISAEAHQHNQSVVHYYFQSKKGLVEAVLDYVASQLRPMQAMVDENLLAMERERQPTVREIVSATLKPVVAWHMMSPIGRRSIRFLSRLTWQVDQDEFDLLVERCLPSYDLMVSQLIKALPEVPRDVVAAKVLFSMINLIHGLASTRVAIGSRSLSTNGVNTLDQEALLEHFIDYMAGGISFARPA